MPYFYSEAEIDVDVDEFLDSCNDREINEVIEWLEDNEYTISKTKINAYGSLLEEDFQNNIRKLSENRLSLSNEEIQIIESIAKRFI